MLTSINHSNYMDPMLIALITVSVLGLILLALYLQERGRREAAQVSLTEREASHQQALSHWQTQLSQAEQRAALSEQNHLQALQQKNLELAEATTQLNVCRVELERLKTEVHIKTEQFNQWQQQLNEDWASKFAQLSQQTLATMHQQLTQQAEATYQDKQALLQKDVGQLLEPLQQLLKTQEEKVLKLNDQTLKEAATLKEQLQQMLDQTRQLALAKDRIVSVLTDNKGRGNWGELQLKRLLEASGLQNGSTYELQPTLSSGGRPDVQINLPNGHVIFIDVKSLIGTLERLELSEDPPDIQEQLVRALKEEIKTLAKRDYASYVNHSIEFVVLYVPRESMLRRPLEHDPDLLETAFKHNIILASPLILMAMLKTVAQGWAQAQISENARQILNEAKTLHKRFATFSDHFVELRQKMDATQKKLDETESSLSRMLLPSARRLEQLGAKSSKNLPAQWQLEEEVATPVETALLEN